MANAGSNRLIIADNKAKLVGIDHPPAKILSRTDTHIAIQIPRHKYNAGARGLGLIHYVPAETIIYQITANLGKITDVWSGSGEGLSVIQILSWEHTR